MLLFPVLKRRRFIPPRVLPVRVGVQEEPPGAAKMRAFNATSLLEQVGLGLEVGPYPNPALPSPPGPFTP